MEFDDEDDDDDTGVAVVDDNDDLLDDFEESLVLELSLVKSGEDFELDLLDSDDNL